MVDSILTPKMLARTYKPPAYADPWECVEDYREVIQTASKHPNLGSTALANRLELPRGRIRPWIDGTKPDCVRGIETADELGWFTDCPDIREAFAICLVTCFACGSVDSHWIPAWAPDYVATVNALATATDTLSITTQTRHDGESERPMELVPTENGTLLGRALVALGAVQGDKNKTSAHTWPAWLHNLSQETRRTAVTVYVAERATHFDEKDTITLQLDERSQAYRDGVAAWIRAVVNSPVTSGERAVTISAAAARELCLRSFT